MARAHRVATSRKEHTCGHGGHIIPVGEGYYWAAPGFRTGRHKKIRCLAHPFRPSELTSGMASEALSAAEAFEDAIDAIEPTSADALDELTAAHEEFSSAIQEYASNREYALDAWENGNSQLEELRDTAQSAADEIDGFQVEDWSGDEEARDRAIDGSDDDDDQEALADWAAHVEDQLNTARDLASLEF